MKQLNKKGSFCTITKRVLTFGVVIIATMKIWKVYFFTFFIDSQLNHKVISWFWQISLTMYLEKGLCNVKSQNKQSCLDTVHFPWIKIEWTWNRRYSWKNFSIFQMKLMVLHYLRYASLVEVYIHHYTSYEANLDSI